jgi:hypothetical protein
VAAPEEFAQPDTITSRAAESQAILKTRAPDYSRRLLLKPKLLAETAIFVDETHRKERRGRDPAQYSFS